MDLALLKQKLGNLNAPQKSGGKTYEKIDYTKVFWKPQVGNHTIRIVPSKFNKQNPFREVYFHYGFAKGPILALNNWGEADPIMEFAAKLRQSKDRDNWALAKKLDPKMRVFVPVIVRGEEHLGVRLWEFGKEVYKSLLGFAADEDYGRRDYPCRCCGNVHQHSDSYDYPCGHRLRFELYLWQEGLLPYHSESDAGHQRYVSGDYCGRCDFYGSR